MNKLKLNMLDFIILAFMINFIIATEFIDPLKESNIFHPPHIALQYLMKISIIISSNL